MIVQGRSEQISFDGTWLTVQKKGEPARPDDQRIHVQDIRAVEPRYGRLVGGHIWIEFVPQNSHSPIATLTVNFRNGQQGDLARLTAVIETARAQAYQPVQPVAPDPTDPAEELRRLWQSVQRGEITKEEFEKAKMRLFG